MCSYIVIVVWILLQVSVAVLLVIAPFQAITSRCSIPIFAQQVQLMVTHAAAQTKPVNPSMGFFSLFHEPDSAIAFSPLWTGQLCVLHHAGFGAGKPGPDQLGEAEDRAPNAYGASHRGTHQELHQRL